MIVWSSWKSIFAHLSLPRSQHALQVPPYASIFLCFFLVFSPLSSGDRARVLLRTTQGQQSFFILLTSVRGVRFRIRGLPPPPPLPLPADIVLLSHDAQFRRVFRVLSGNERSISFLCFFHTSSCLQHPHAFTYSYTCKSVFCAMISTGKQHPIYYAPRLGPRICSRYLRCDDTQVKRRTHPGTGRAPFSRWR